MLQWYRDVPLTLTPMTNNNLQALTSVAVVGASGGLGSEFVRQLSALDNVERVFALSRSGVEFDDVKVSASQLDCDDETSIEAAADTIASETHLDAIFVATGLLHDDELQPEKRLQDLDMESMLASFRINAVGPILVAKHFLPLLRGGQRTLFAALSARVGSISDNRLGGWASYRASKAALNMLLRTAAIEQTRHCPEAIIAALHPGTVDTRLSAPFQSNVPADKLFTPQYAVERLLAVVNILRPADSGGFFAWDGNPVPF